MSKVGHNNPPADQGGGWVAIRRAMREHWLVGFGQAVTPCDPDRGAYSRAEAFIDLIMECRYEAGTVNNGGRKMRLERGQLLGAVSWLASRWNWTPKTVRGFLEKLEDDEMIERFSPGTKGELNGSQLGKQKGKQSSVITVCNYYAYQLVDYAKGPAKEHAEGTQGASKGHAEGNTNKDNKGTKEQGNKKAKQPPPEFADKELCDRLLDACNGALDNPVNCQGLLIMAEPRMWLDQGCDLEKDILPTLRDIGRREHGKRIRSWSYFTGPIADAKRAREKGKVTFNEAGEVETQAQRYARYAQEAEQRESRK